MAGSTQRPEQLLAVVRTALAQLGVLGEFKAFAAVEGHRRTVTVARADGGFAGFEVTVEGGRAVAVAL